jgi:tetratricopeptide (TPR) repeat protein
MRLTMSGGVAEREKIPASQLQPILESIGAGDTPTEQMAERLRLFVEGARARASEPAPLSNDGADIDAAIDAARDKLRRLDAAGARDLLRARIDEEGQTRRRRLLPLLRERAAVERLAFDHEAAKATFAQITELDPDAVWDWISLGDLWVTTGSLAAALGAYGKAEAAARRIGDERDLSVSHDRIGNVKLSQGDLPGALAAYTASTAIAERLAARDPANSDWQRDLSVSHNRIGDVKVSQGDLPGALAAYTEDMAIAERLAARDPDNSDWQRDLIVSRAKVARVAPEQARRLLTRALDIVRELARSGRLAPADAWMPEDLEQRLAALPNG